MMFTQLNPPLPVFIPAKNESALAHGVIDYGPEQHLMWVCFLNSNGECWTMANPEIRIEWNPSLGRKPKRAPDNVVNVSAKGQSAVTN